MGGIYWVHADSKSNSSRASSGNHEFYEGAKNARYLDQTWQKWGPIYMPEAADTMRLEGSTSATSAIGAFLSAGNHHSAATSKSSLGNSVPSNTSRYFSVDFGLTHLVALSLNGYNGVVSPHVCLL